MKQRFFCITGFIIVVLLAFTAIPANAQTVANGPYYATPSWDQTLPSSTRFIVLSNFNSQAVLDRETGLVWERSPSTSGFIWNNAQTRCNNLTIGARMGWRLPTVHELASLIDPTQPNFTDNPTLPTGHPFQNVLSDTYWSANTNTSASAPAAYTVTFRFASVGSSNKSLDFIRAWCVRGGQGVDFQ
jgi:uncharacterized protein DUF1566